MATAYELLGVNPQASREELQAAYAARLAEYAPERVASLPAEFQRLAEQRRAELQAAFHELRAGLAAPVRLPPDAERRRDRETLIALVALLLLWALVPLARPFGAPARTAEATGADAAMLSSELAPDFTARALDGRTVRLSDYRGQVVLLNFWATWCPPCVRETPRLVEVAEQYRGRGLVVLGVNTTYQDDAEKVRRFVDDQRIAYPVLLDPEGQIGEKYAARLMPTTYLLDRDGRIVHTKVSEVEAAALSEQIEAVLRQ